MIEFYLHAEMPEDRNERRALFRMATLLQSAYADGLRDHFVLIGNIDPQQDPRFSQFPHLPQLDALLLGPRLVAIVEFKNYYDRIVGSERGNWFAYPTGWRPGKTPQIVRGGSAANPYQQARKAKGEWISYLSTQMSGIMWKHLQDFVLFHPWLHEGSDIQVTGLDHYWLHFAGVEQIVPLVQSNNSLNGVKLTAVQMRQIAELALGAQRWRGIERALAQRIGMLYVSFDGKQIGYPLRSYQEVTIGRETANGEHIQVQSSLVSRWQARVVTQATAVRLFDMDSKNGTWLEDERVDDINGRLLPPGTIVRLGGQGTTVTHLWFEPYQPQAPENMTGTKTG